MLVGMMRSNQRWLMIVISVLTIISFLWFFSNRTQVDRMVSDKAGTIYGRTLSTTEVERTRREILTAADLGLSNLVDQDIATARDWTGTVVNHLVLIHQAQALGIYPSDDEIVEAEKQLPVFQGAGGGFDSAKYAEFVGDKLSPRGFSETQLEELVRRNLQFGKLREIVGGAVVISPLDVRTAYEQSNTKTDAEVVHFPLAELAAAIQPTEADIKKYYDEQSASHNLQQPEKRQVQYIRFGLDETQAKLAGKARMEALQPQADRAAQFLEKLLDRKGKEAFTALAKEENLPVRTTADFEESQTAGFEEAAMQGFAEAAFRLTERDPESDVPLQTRDGFYVLHLSKVTPERPLTLDEARPKIVTAIKEERAQTALAAKAEEIRTKIAAAMKTGRNFHDAATAAGQTVQDVPAFSAMEPPKGQPHDADIAAAVLELGSGELSKFVPTSDGGLLVYVRGREAIDEQKFAAQSARLVESMGDRKRRFYFYEWLKASRDAANVQLNNGLQQNEEG